MTPLELTLLPSLGESPAHGHHPIPIPANNEITKLFLISIQQFNKQPGSVLSDEAAASLSAKLTKIAIDNKLDANEVRGLLLNRYLQIETFIDNERLIPVFEQVMKDAFTRYDAQFPKGNWVYARTALAKVVSAAFDKISISQKGSIVGVDGHKFLVRLKVKRSELFAIDLSTEEDIDSGKFLIASNALDLIRFSKVAIKRRFTDDPNDNKKMCSEKRALKEIHRIATEKSLPANDIKSSPYAIFGMGYVDKGKPNAGIVQWNDQAGMIEEEYRCTLFDLLDSNITVRTRLLVCRQLLSGLVTIHATGYAHGDYKLENVLIKGFGEELQAHITDFADAISKSKILADPDSFKEDPVRGFTSYYCLQSDLEREWEDGRTLNIEEASDVVVSDRQQRDVFGLGIVIASILSGVSPFANLDESAVLFSEGQYPDLDKQEFEEEMKKIVPADKFEALKDLIWSMLIRNPNNRLKAPEALAAFDKIGCL